MGPRAVKETGPLVITLAILAPIVAVAALVWTLAYCGAQPGDLAAPRPAWPADGGATLQGR